jgi:hypothetical protein
VFVADMVEFKRSNEGGSSLSTDRRFGQRL